MAIRDSFSIISPFLACAMMVVAGDAQTNPPQPTTHQVDVQLIQVSSGGGSDIATVFGTEQNRENIEGRVNTIWAQCGIRVNFLPTINAYANDFALDGSPGDYTDTTRPTSHLISILNSGDSAGAGNSDPAVIDAYFVDIVPGFNFLGTGFAAGLARVDGNGTALFVSSELPSFSNGRNTTAFVFAHELGHNLGLNHVAANSANLMSESGSTGQQLTAAQCTTVFSDNTFTLDGFDFLNPVTSVGECDFDGDGQCDLDDLDFIYSAMNTSNILLNLDDTDGLDIINEADVVAWLGLASDSANPYKANLNDVYVVGDIDLDGDVDSQDLGVLIAYFGDSSGRNWRNGNLTSDVNIDENDLGLLLNNFGHESLAANVSVSATSVSIPEPTSLWLWTCVVGIGMLRRRVSAAPGIRSRRASAADRRHFYSNGAAAEMEGRCFRRL